ncbi:hypothetical protein HYG81_09135 [Natrinema zhouii]|uniref:DUF1795 domain-containing protein n=1 Tax=Natrinema zhouii TaxID=1710539 RepID=A0A7D6H228_9EURY|nr:hypothetical protein [Natrinema zhouii]QLK27745.1 hypothetical protein HYG81_09135 [Natrinema zhouii]
MPANREETGNTAGRASAGRTDGAGDDEMDGVGPTPTFEMYADDEYGYRLAYPTTWSAKTEPAGGVSFDDRTSSAGATVSVDEGVALTLAEYVADFLEALETDEHIRAIERLERRDRFLENGETGQVIDCAYWSVPDGERWRLTYLFVREGGNGYVLGVDWNDDDGLDELAARIVESFAVETN